MPTSITPWRKPIPAWVASDQSLGLRGEILPPPPETVEEFETIEVRVEPGAPDEDAETGTIADDIVPDDDP